ncbi:hypothetical protein C8R46DRAFT_1081389 [Mycena filopes]|nr:hypothetical protein C8R46DRAFT_1081389 [Mycena filopes]
MLRFTSASIRRSGALKSFERQLSSANSRNSLRRPSSGKQLLTHSALMRRTYSTEEPTSPKPPQESEEDAITHLEKFATDVSTLVLAGEAPDEQSCLHASYAVVYEIMRYLARHGDDGAEAYLSIFMNSEAPPHSPMARARTSIFQLTEHLVSILSSVPALRVSQPVLTGLVGALEPCVVVYRESDQDTRAWTAFWSRAQPILLELGGQLRELEELADAQDGRLN